MITPPLWDVKGFSASSRFVTGMLGHLHWFLPEIRVKSHPASDSITAIKAMQAICFFNCAPPRCQYRSMHCSERFSVLVWGICSGSRYILSPTYSHFLPLIYIYQIFVGQKLVTVCSCFHSSFCICFHGQLCLPKWLIFYFWKPSSQSAISTILIPSYWYTSWRVRAITILG